MKPPHCPNCGSIDVDLEFKVCRTCGIGLPIGSFDVRPRMRHGRAGMRAYATQSKVAHSDSRTNSIVGSRQQGGPK